TTAGILATLDSSLTGPYAQLLLEAIYGAFLELLNYDVKKKTMTEVAASREKNWLFEAIKHRDEKAFGLLAGDLFKKQRAISSPADSRFVNVTRANYITALTFLRKIHACANRGPELSEYDAQELNKLFKQTNILFNARRLKDLPIAKAEGSAIRVTLTIVPKLNK
ncbi:MAG: hypothetical protein AAGB32_03620, partial [Pseudomonadota bacterium]